MENLQNIGSCFHDFHFAHGLVLSLFLAGLVGGFSHCVAMCGPFVVAQSGQMEKITDGLLLPYHIGRLITYVFLSVLFYSVLNLVFLYLPIRAYVIAPILFVASFLFLMNAFPQIAKIFPWAHTIRISIPYQWVNGAFQKLSSDPTSSKKLIMGMILGFMPCGMVTTALIASATAPDIVTAALAMAAFGAGTIPALVITAYGAQAIQLKYPLAMPYITKGMMLWSSAWLLILAGLTLIQTR